MTNEELLARAKKLRESHREKIAVVVDLKAQAANLERMISDMTRTAHSDYNGANRLAEQFCLAVYGEDSNVWFEWEDDDTLVVHATTSQVFK